MFSTTLFKRWTSRFFAPYVLQRETYEAFKRLLEHDHRCHELIADLQELYLKKEPTEWAKVVFLYDRLSKAINEMVQEFGLLSPGEAKDLATYLKKFDSYIRFLLQPETNPTGPPYTLCLSNPHLKLQLAGNKANNLAKVQQYTECSVPPGFVITTNCWHSLVKHNNLRTKIDRHLFALDPEDSHSLHETSRHLIALITGADIPADVDVAIKQACDDLIFKCNANTNLRFAVRSSAINEDGLNSFAGQYLSLLNIPPADLVDCYLQVLASKYSPQALLYRINAGISDQAGSMAVLILEMVKAKAAGVIYTADPKGQEPDTLFIHSVAGSCEKLVDGAVEPLTSRFDKKKATLKADHASNSPISQQEATKLALLATTIEKFFSSSQDIEWALGESGPIILQSRPLRTAATPPKTSLEENYHVPNIPLLYHGGITGSKGKASGVASILTADHKAKELAAGAVLIVENIPSSLILLLPGCSAVIASGGSVASHFSTICRELGVPLIVGATTIKEKIIAGELVTVDADNQNVYRGSEATAPTSPEHSLQDRNNAPFYARLQPILDFISPLSILDPEADSFTPENCRALHDIVRFAHEKAVRTMFSIGKTGSRRGHRKKLTTKLPFDLYLIDVDSNGPHEAKENDDITIDQVRSTPFLSLWQGLTHPAVIWEDRQYYNWRQYDNAAMTDSFAFKNKADSASYAVCGSDYLNLNIKFGYHFTVVDCLCADNSEQNYCSIRFGGGGGTMTGQHYRLKYVDTILQRLGFKVSRKTDFLDGRIESLPKQQMQSCLVSVGRMLGSSKQLDMVLKDNESLAAHLDLFYRTDDRLAEKKDLL